VVVLVSSDGVEAIRRKWFSMVSPGRMEWRRERDSNPRYPFEVRFFSKEVLSTTQPSLRDPRIAEVWAMIELECSAIGVWGKRQNGKIE